MKIPQPIEQDIIILLGKENQNVSVSSFEPASGGCINNGGRVTTSCGDYFVKWNSSTRYPGMFKAEGDGLKLLADPQCIIIPAVIGSGEGDEFGWILLEYISSSSRKSDYWSQLGQRLARLHSNSSSSSFGLEHDNYIGSLHQKNAALSNWVEFIITRRFEPMVKLAFQNNRIEKKTVGDFERLYGKLKGLLVHEKPSLLHGDLWSGNIMVDEQGSPVLIDPAVYYGNREVDLAFTTLFGGFEKDFYEAYQQEWPVEGGFEDRFEIYNLYPLLVHVNLFGGSYINQVKQIISRFV